MARRKDNKGRVLHTGECQRKNGTYTYKYKDVRGKWRSTSAATLEHLREKERIIEQTISHGIDYSSKKITILDAVKRHVEVKSRTIRSSSLKNYNNLIHMLEREDYAYKNVRDVNVTDAQLWLLDIQEAGYAYKTIESVKTIISAAFKRLCNDKILLFNPFDFKLNEAIKNTSKKRQALTPKQQKQLLEFLLNENIGLKYYDEVIVLLWTGMRASEFCGLTVKDIDFENGFVHVRRQLKKEHGIYTVEETKTESGNRSIPMIGSVYDSLRRVVAQRKKQPVIFSVGERSQFLFLTNRNMPKTGGYLHDDLKRIVERHNKKYPNDPLPKITPHTLRHTFCTNITASHVVPCAIQYMMGHANYKTTADVYTHPDAELAMQEMKKLQA